MNQYVFILGNHPDLSQAEIKSYFRFMGISATFSSVSSEILLVNTANILNFKKIINTLGGTIKIAQVAGNFKFINSFENLLNFLKFENISNLDFGLSFYNYPITTQTIFHYCKNIKNYLRKNNIKANYTVPQKGTALSSAQVDKKIFPEGQELIIFNYNKEVYCAQTLVIQDIKLFSTLDYGIPFIDPKVGMLPPKLAQIMINIGLPEKKSDIKIYDPFCGQGRIVLQSLMQGFEAYGSDKSSKAVIATSKNIVWLKNKFHLNIADDYAENHIFCQDASQENTFLKAESVDVIVCEPDLGPAYRNMISDTEIEKIFSNLGKLYIDSFARFKKILAKDGKIVCIFPMINNKSLLDKIVDNILNLGYYMEDDFKYGRSYQVVKRHIGVFKIKF